MLLLHTVLVDGFFLSTLDLWYSEQKECTDSGVPSAGTTVARSRNPQTASALWLLIWSLLICGSLTFLAWDRRDKGDMTPKGHPTTRWLPGYLRPAHFGEDRALLDKTPTSHSGHLNLPTAPLPKPMSKWILQTVHWVLGPAWSLSPGCSRKSMDSDKRGKNK